MEMHTYDINSGSAIASQVCNDQVDLVYFSTEAFVEPLGPNLGIRSQLVGALYPSNHCERVLADNHPTYVTNCEEEATHFFELIRRNGE